jgi:hypothetical protein
VRVWGDWPLKESVFEGLSIAGNPVFLSCCEESEVSLRDLIAEGDGKYDSYKYNKEERTLYFFFGKEKV